MAILQVLTATEVEAEWSQTISVERLDLIDVKLENNYELPHIEVTGFTNKGVAMAIIPKSYGKNLYFEDAIPFGYVPDATISVLGLASVERTIGDTVKTAALVLIKRVARIRIERSDNLLENEIDITLSCGPSDITLTCAISDLAGFISQAPETDNERTVQDEREEEERYHELVMDRQWSHDLD